jgi:hypothetical protein
VNLKAVPDGILGSLLCSVDDVTDLQVESPVLHHLALVCSQVYLKENKDPTELDRWSSTLPVFQICDVLVQIRIRKPRPVRTTGLQIRIRILLFSSVPFFVFFCLLPGTGTYCRYIYVSRQGLQVIKKSQNCRNQSLFLMEGSVSENAQIIIDQYPDSPKIYDPTDLAPKHCTLLHICRDPSRRMVLKT